MLRIDTSKIMGCLDMNDDTFVEGNACEMIYLRDELVAVIKYQNGIPEEDILSLNKDHMIARIKYIGCWIPVLEGD